MKLTLSILALCLLTGCASPDGGRDVAGIRNSRWVDKAAMVAVSSEPNWQQLLTLQSVGFTNVICFDHRKFVVPLEMKVHCFYISTWRQIVGGKKLDKAFEDALAVMGPNTLVFCRHGANRSGTFYIVLLMRQGFTKEQAIAMADVYDWDSSFCGLKSYVRRLP